MASRDIIDIFEDCTQRIASGQSIEDCLRVYPEYAAQLRPLLETQASLRLLQFTQPEILEDQEVVWRQITTQLPLRLRRSRRNRPPYQLLLVAILFFGLAAAMFALTRPNLPPDEDPILIGTELKSEAPDPAQAVTPTAEITPLPSSTSTTQPLSPTMTTSVTTSNTPLPPNSPAPTSVPTQTAAPLPTVTVELTSTFAPGCGAPLTADDAISRVLEIYPNTTIISAKQVIKFSGTQVWEIQTSHRIEVNIDVACGYILTIEQDDEGSSNDDNNDDNSGSSNNNSDDDNSGSSNNNSDDDDDDD